MSVADDPWKPDEPTSARVSNALLGGWNHTAADQAAAAELEEACPAVRRMALDSRLFTARAVAYAAGEGIGQVIDLGAGLPPPLPLPMVHDMARAVLPDARVCYVDHDPEVADFLAVVTLGDGKDGIMAVTADLRNPVAVLSHPGLLEVIDPAQPVCVILGLVLHFSCGGLAAALVRQYARRVAAGSYIAVSVPVFGDEVAWRKVRQACPRFTWNHSPGDLRRFLGGLEVVPPGIAPARCLRPGWKDCARPGEPNYVLAGIGRKP